MSSFTVILSKKAQKQLDKFPDIIADPILLAIEGLQNDPRPIGYIKLKNREGYRIRSGDYRIIYDIFDSELIIDVITLGHRKDVYK
ncbi:MAG: type II toxin-antitoxin system RelE/ParE family toxin [Saprospiraceae bacterium]|nr:type II toxin-antitoxin system RelE/ParE family toxin [Candidatus Defluviibacterium haderslevense]